MMRLVPLALAGALTVGLMAATPVVAGASTPARASRPAVLHSNPDAAQYVAMGDSYASGEGAFDYIPSSNTSTDQCHRALDGYAEGLSQYLDLSLGFPACSGDVISDFFSSNVSVASRYVPEASQVSPDGGDVGEPAQLSQLGPPTQVVTVSIGGNDVGFVPVLTDCIQGLVGASGRYGCQNRDSAAVTQNLSYLSEGRPSTCLPWLPAAESPVNTWEFCSAEPPLQKLYADIATEAPNAAIYVVGYPHIFGDTFKGGVCQVGSVGLITYTIKNTDVDWLNAEADQLDSTLAAAVTAAAEATGRKIVFVDPRPTFAGHGLCDTGTAYINPLEINLLGLTPKSESFHPNYTGQQALLTLLETTVTAGDRH